MQAPCRSQAPQGAGVSVLGTAVPGTKAAAPLGGLEVQCCATQRQAATFEARCLAQGCATALPLHPNPHPPASCSAWPRTATQPTHKITILPTALDARTRKATMLGSRHALRMATSRRNSFSAIYRVSGPDCGGDRGGGRCVGRAGGRARPRGHVQRRRQAAARRTWLQCRAWQGHSRQVQRAGLAALAHHQHFDGHGLRAVAQRLVDLQAG